MFAVLFEVNPAPGNTDKYLDVAKTLRPELEAIEGFVENVRYKSLQREGWILSVSSWEDEKAVVRWRTKANHNGAQRAGRNEILQNYHLRVGQFVADNKLPAGQTLQEQRLDMTQVGVGPFATLITAKRPEKWNETSNATDCAQFMGLDFYSGDALIEWDVYEAVLPPGDLILMLVWKDKEAMDAFGYGEAVNLPDGHRVRHVRVVRDYGMYDRREAPQYYPDAKGEPTRHS